MNNTLRAVVPSDKIVPSLPIILPFLPFMPKQVEPQVGCIDDRQCTLLPVLIDEARCFNLFGIFGVLKIEDLFFLATPTHRSVY
jgi:hypothetical protein